MPSHNPYLTENDPFFYFKWRFIEQEVVNHDLVLLKFRHEDTFRELNVHTHPIDHRAHASTSCVTAVECPRAGRLADSTERYNRALHGAAIQHLHSNPIRRRTPAQQGVNNGPAFNEAVAKEQLAQHGEKHQGSGFYRPGAFSAAKGNA